MRFGNTWSLLWFNIYALKLLWRWKYLMNLATATMADNPTVNDVRIIISGPREASGTTTWGCLTHHRSIRGQGTAKRKRRKCKMWVWRRWDERESTGERRVQDLIAVKILFDEVVILGDLWGRPRKLRRGDVFRRQTVKDSVGGRLRFFAYCRPEDNWHLVTSFVFSVMLAEPFVVAAATPTADRNFNLQHAHECRRNPAFGPMHNVEVCSKLMQISGTIRYYSLSIHI